MKWDCTKKKFIGQVSCFVILIVKRVSSLNILLIGRRHTELGFWIPATYKTDRYERWKGKSKVDQNEEVSDDTGEDEKGPSRFDGNNQRRGVPMGIISTGSSARGFPRTCGKLAHRWNKRAYINFSNRKDAVDD